MYMYVPTQSRQCDTQTQLSAASVLSLPLSRTLPTSNSLSLSQRIILVVSAVVQVSWCFTPSQPVWLYQGDAVGYR